MSWTSVLRIRKLASDSHLLPGKFVLSFSNAAIFFSGSEILLASRYAC